MTGAFGFGVGLDLRQQPIITIGGPSAPVLANKMSLHYGDSRTDDGMTSANTGTGLARTMASIGYISWLVLLSGGRIVPGRFANFSVPASTTYHGAAIPRQGFTGVVQPGDSWRSSSATLYTSNKGADFAELHEAGMVFNLYGTNDGAVSDAGYADVGASRANQLTILGNAPSKTHIMLNELPKGINDDGSSAGYNVSANFKSYSDWLLTLDYASGSPNARSNVIAVDTFGEFVDPATGTLYRNKRGYLRDGLHLTGYGGKRIAAKIIERLRQVYPDFDSWPVQHPLPTSNDNGLTSLGDAQPFVNSNADMRPGTNGSVLGTWGGAPAAANIMQGWTITPSNANASGITCVADKTLTTPGGMGSQRLTFSGTLGAGLATQIQFQQILSTATLFANGWLTINDMLRAVGLGRVAAGSQYFAGLALAVQMQSGTVNKYQTIACNRGGGFNMGAPAYLDAYEGEWLTYCTEVLDMQDPGKVALGQNITAQGDISQIILRWEIDFRNLSGTTQNIGAVVDLAQTGLKRVSS